MSEVIVTTILLLANLLPADDQRALPALPEHHVCTSIDVPAILHVYDPALGGINCDGDCGTVATGPLTVDMYKRSGACPAQLLGSNIYFDDIDVSMECVDNGGAIKPAWSERDNMCVVFFDMLWPLEVVDERIVGAPEWNHWWLPNWRVTWEQ